MTVLQFNQEVFSLKWWWYRGYEIQSERKSLFCYTLKCYLLYIFLTQSNLPFPKVVCHISEFCYGVVVGGRPRFRRQFFFVRDSELLKAWPPMRQFCSWFDAVLGFLVCCEINSLCHTPPTMICFSVPIPPY